MTTNKTFGVPGHRGVPLIFAWGPHTGLSYQRPEWKQISLAQLRRDAIDFFVKWGANLVELYPSNKESHFDDYTLAENSAVPAYCFREHPDSDQEHRWTLDEFRAFNRHAHDQDFMVSWMIHTWWPTPHPVRAKVLWRLCRELGQEVGDVLADGFGFHIDGYAAEGDFVVPEEANDLLWPFHPGLYVRESAWGLTTTAANYIQPRGFHLTDGRVLMYAREDYMGLAPECWRGHEPIWRGEEIKVQHGRLYVSLQADGRDVKCQDERWSMYGGMGTVDMLLEQVNNYARAKGRGWTTAGTTAIRVINEPLMSAKMKRYMAGMCSDPVRCAIAAELEATTKDGRYPLTKYEKGTWFVQNNVFRAYLQKNTGAIDVYYDQSQEGNFHNFIWSTSNIILDDFLKSTFAADQKLRFHECKELEESGARGVVRQRCEFGSEKTTMVELRDFQAEADNPWLGVRIQRVFVGQKASATAVTDLSFDGYRVKGAIKPGEVLTLDPPAGKPPIIVFIPENDQIEKVYSEKPGVLSIRGREARSHDFWLGIAFGLENTLSQEQLQRLARFHQRELSFDLCQGREKVELSGPDDVETVRSIRLVNPSTGPYHVRENGWWMARGAQPSWDRRGTDLLKVVLSPGSPTLVQAYGFIEGAVKSGWGCQYLQLLRDVKVKEGGVSVRVRVVDINPKVWAPRLHFVRGIAQATVNGKAWHYFDGPFLFLPNHRGDYEVTVTFGQCGTPHPLCTFAVIENTRWDHDQLVVKTCLPEWADDLAFGASYYLAVANAGKRLSKVVNGEIRRTIPDFDTIKPAPLAGPEGIATLVPRDYNHPPITGYRNARGHVIAFCPPVELILSYV
jgi:hypothetical protein